MLAIVRDLFNYNRQFRLGAILVAAVAGMAALSLASPYPPLDTFVVAPDLPPSLAHPFGTTSRGQDVFWHLSFAIRNTLLFGIVVALMSRVLALAIGLIAGYKGGWLDRLLMAINDTFIAIPLFPILVLVYFVLREAMSWAVLAGIMALLGWAYDARLIRALALSLKTRDFTHTGIFSGMSTRELLVREHLPYVLPIVFATSMNNMNWSIGLEVTLSVLGFTDINSPTVGGMIYWANQHTALVAGVWWWIAFPVILVVALFIGLFLLAVSMNEHIDPRSRLRRMGAEGGA
jgi:peptide/nickel transport system permease protein